MNVFKFIDEHVIAKQIPYIRLLTVYVKDGSITQLCLTRYNDKKIAKKAAKVGLKEERTLIEIKPNVRIDNPETCHAGRATSCDVSKGDYYMNYYIGTHELVVFQY